MFLWNVPVSLTLYDWGEKAQGIQFPIVTYYRSLATYSVSQLKLNQNKNILLIFFLNIILWPAFFLNLLLYLLWHSLFSKYIF